MKIPTAPIGRIRPGDGFYIYVNGKWLNTHHMKDWQSEYGTSDEIEKKTNSDLLKSILSLGTKLVNLRPMTPEGHLQLFRHIWTKSKVSSEEDFLRICLDNLMISTSPDSMGRFFGWLCRSRVPTLIQISTAKEEDKPYFIRSSINPGNLILPIKYYTDSSLRDSETWKAYIKFVSVCSIELGLPFLVKAIEAETQIANKIKKHSDGDTIEKNGYSLVKWAHGFEWNAFMEGLHVDPQWLSRLWIVNAPNIVGAILQWVCTAETESVAAVFALHFIKFASIHLRPSIQAATENLFGNSLMGLQKTSPKNLLYLSSVKEILPSVLCTFYSKQQSKIHKIDDIEKLVNRLRDSTVSILKRSTLFSKPTYRQTIEKVHRMKFQIGKGFKNALPDVTYTPDSILHTILTILSDTTNVLMKNTGKSANRIDGYYPCFQVNASYYAELNSIILPWGILQEPFYSTNAPLGWNYGGIGAVIGHEITHAFDLEGSLYNARAIYKDTWTRKNRDAFQRQTRKVDKFYSKFKHYGRKIDGKKTLSENWADLGGVKISMNALNSELDSLGVSDKIRRSAHRNFFIAYATSWRCLIRKKKLVLSMMNSVHSPAEDRVDRIVPHIQEWVDAFDVNQSDALFLEPKDRLKFF